MPPLGWWWVVALIGITLAGLMVARRGGTHGLMGRVVYVALIAGASLVGLRQGAIALDPSCPVDSLCTLGLPRGAMIEGWIATEPVERSGRLRFDFEMAALREGDRWKAQTGRIRVWARGLDEGWHEGSCLRAQVWLRHPRGFNNPGSFDYVRYLRRHGIRVTGTIWDGTSVERCARRRGRFSEMVVAIRRRIAASVDEAVATEPAAVIRALVVGDRSGLSKSQRTSYARAGVAHVLAISGLHLAVVAGAVFAALRFLAGRSEAILARGLAPRLAALGTLPVTIAYGVLAGGRAPTLRATVMISVYLMGWSGTGGVM